jgi:hypothetical protein
MSSSTLDRSAVINTGPIIALVAPRQSLDILPLLYRKLIPIAVIPSVTGKPDVFFRQSRKTDIA